jgi:pimeloyl-ACP methyl ester carboxylesterase
VLRAAVGEGFYQIYFQQPGVAEADLGRDVRRTVRSALYAASGDSPTLPNMLVDPRRGFLGDASVPDHLPDWLSEADVDAYAADFERTGFAGGLNWYRNIDRNWELLAPWAGAQISVPALYVVGDRDVVYHFPGGGEQLVSNLRRSVPNLKHAEVLHGCGHWTQQERPAEVNRLLLTFVS